MPTPSSTLFSDFSMSMTVHPTTRDIPKLANEEAVKRSIKNLLLTNKYERPYYPLLGSSIRSILFEPMSPAVAALLQNEIKVTLGNNEPRASVDDIRVIPNADDNGYEVQIQFTLINSFRTQLVEVFLTRLR